MAQPEEEAALRQDRRPDSNVMAGRPESWNTPAVNAPVVNPPVMNTTEGNARQGNAPQNNAPQGNVQQGNVPQNNTPQDNVPEANVQAGNVREEDRLLGNPQDLQRLEEEEQEDIGPHKLWEGFRKRYAKIQAFDSANGCEILTIKPQDIGLLPRENWNYGNNSFLLHGYYNYRPDSSAP